MKNHQMAQYLVVESDEVRDGIPIVREMMKDE